MNHMVVSSHMIKDKASKDMSMQKSLEVERKIVAGTLESITNFLMLWALRIYTHSESMIYKATKVIRHRYMLRIILISAGVTTLCLFGILLTSEKFQPKNSEDIRNYGLLLTAIVAACFAGWRLTLSARGQVTERFTKAIDQLGSLKGEEEIHLEVRLGGIYALEAIAYDSERFHWPIMRILTAYIKENSPNVATESHGNEPIATDIQAILTVLSNRRWYRYEPQRINLPNVNLSKGVFKRANSIDSTLKMQI